MTNISELESYYETKVTYTMKKEDKIIENVPARVSVETGKRLCSLENVEKLQELFVKTNHHND